MKSMQQNSTINVCVQLFKRKYVEKNDKIIIFANATIHCLPEGKVFMIQWAMDKILLYHHTIFIYFKHIITLHYSQI